MCVNACYSVFQISVKFFNLGSKNSITMAFWAFLLSIFVCVSAQNGSFQNNKGCDAKAMDFFIENSWEKYLDEMNTSETVELVLNLIIEQNRNQYERILTKVEELSLNISKLMDIASANSDALQKMNDQMFYMKIYLVLIGVIWLRCIVVMIRQTRINWEEKIEQMIFEVQG